MKPKEANWSVLKDKKSRKIRVHANRSFDGDYYFERSYSEAKELADKILEALQE